HRRTGPAGAAVHEPARGTHRAIPATYSRHRRADGRRRCRMNLSFNLAEWLPHLLDGVVITLEITALCIAMGIVLGLILAIARLYGRNVVYWTATIYINFFRGTPVLAQLFLVYYGLPTIGLRLDPFTAGVLALGANTAAYQAEYF